MSESPQSSTSSSGSGSGHSTQPTSLPSPSPTTALKFSLNGCWTCKARKIGCDRALPYCRNCNRTNRECLGYGIRLAWPEEHPDGRRRKTNQPDAAQYFVELPDRTRRFINVSTEEVEAARKDDVHTARNIDLPLVARQSIGRVERTRAYMHFEDTTGADNQFLTYYHNIIATLISTTKTRNGFQQELLPMALSPGDPASAALRNAMMAVAALHQHGTTAALPHKTAAIRNMSLALSNSSSSSDAQIAAAMMLCVYNVFDETEGQWHIHLNGARHILRRRAWDTPLSEFLWTWFLYHDVLGCFTQPMSTPDELVAGPPDLDREVIIGALGCSFEVLEGIHRTNLLRKHHNSPNHLASRSRIYLLLSSATQHLDPTATADPAPRRTQILATAEFYRLAALIYLLRAAPSSHTHPSDAEQREAMLEQALAVLESMDRCTSPWPLFMVACEATDDEKRMRVLEILEGMGEERQIGNLLVMRGLVQGVWNRMDLRGGAREEAPWDLIQAENAAPWFI